MDFRRLRELLRDAAELRDYRAKKAAARGKFRFSMRVALVRDGVRRRAHAEWPGAYVPDDDGRLWYLPAPLDVAGGRRLLKPGIETHPIARHLCKPGETILDVGANLGEWTVSAAESVGPSGRVLAFEPNPGVADALEKTLAANRLAWVKVFRQALADAPGTAPFSVERENSGGSRLGRMASDEYRGKRRTFETIEVRISTIDQVIGEEKLDRAHVIKIDTEGHEAAVLRGARDTLRAHRPALFLETGHESADARRDIAGLLRGGGYRIAAFFLGAGAVEASWDDYLGSAALREVGVSDMLCLHGAAGI